MDALVLPRSRNTHQVADRFGHPPAAPDHLAGLVRRDGQLVRDCIAPSALLDLYGFGIIYQIAGHVLKQCFHRPSIRRTTNDERRTTAIVWFVICPWSLVATY